MRKNTFNILFFVKKNEPKKNGRSTLMVRITINGDKVQFSTGADVDLKLWDQYTNRAIGNSFEARALNKLIDQVRIKLQIAYMELYNRHLIVTPILVKNDFLGINESATLISQFKELLKSYEPKIGKTIVQETYYRYELTMRRMQEYLKEIVNVDDLPIQKVNIGTLEGFEIFLRNKYAHKHNHTMKHMQRLASVMLFAERNGILHHKPFKDYKIFLKTNNPTFLTRSEIDKIYKKRFVTRRLCLIRNLYIFCCFTGLSFSDVCKLRRSDIVQDFGGNYWVSQNRTKTDVVSQIPLLSVPLKIIGSLNKFEYDDLIFKTSSNQRTNEYLREIAGLCGIDKHLTFHTSRHTFAMMMLNNGVSIESVSRMMGHTSTKTTQIYARITNKKLLEEINKVDKAL